MTRPVALRILALAAGIGLVSQALLLGNLAGIGVLRVTSAARRIGPSLDADRTLPRLPPWAGPVVRGLLIAIPLLLVFGSLFSAADTAFERLMGRLFTW